MKVLFHIDDGTRWNMLLGNAENMLAYGNENGFFPEIEITANGPAVRELQLSLSKELGLSDRLEALGEKVRICACNNALNSQKIPPDALLPFVTVVSAGVVEIALRQQQGFAYIKP